MSPLAAAATGLRGTMFTRVLMPNRFCSERTTFSPASDEYSAMSAVRMAGSSDSPGRITFTSIRPTTTATAVVARKMSRVLVPTLPMRRRSPSDATPMVTEAKTRGTTIMNSRRRKICPTGCATLSVIQVRVGESPA